jgi:hypothetical protein
MRTACPHCFSPADWIDQVTTYCPECPELANDRQAVERAKLVSRQAEEGIKAYLRGREKARVSRETRA